MYTYPYKSYLKCVFKYLFVGYYKAICIFLNLFFLNKRFLKPKKTPSKDMILDSLSQRGQAYN